MKIPTPWFLLTILIKIIITLTWARSMLKFMFHYYFLMLELPMPSHHTPVEHPVQTAPVIHYNDGILTLWKFVTCYYHLHTKHQL